MPPTPVPPGEISSIGYLLKHPSWATTKDFESILEGLKQWEFDPNAIHNNTPLWIESMTRFRELTVKEANWLPVLKVLIEKGADPTYFLDAKHDLKQCERYYPSTFAMLRCLNLDPMGLKGATFAADLLHAASSVKGGNPLERVVEARNLILGEPVQSIEGLTPKAWVVACGALFDEHTTGWGSQHGENADTVIFKMNTLRGLLEDPQINMRSLSPVEKLFAWTGAAAHVERGIRGSHACYKASIKLSQAAKKVLFENRCPLQKDILEEALNDPSIAVHRKERMAYTLLMCAEQLRTHLTSEDIWEVVPSLLSWVKPEKRTSHVWNSMALSIGVPPPYVLSRITPSQDTLHAFLSIAAHQSQRDALGMHALLGALPHWIEGAPQYKTEMLDLLTRDKWSSTTKNEDFLSSIDGLRLAVETAQPVEAPKSQTFRL